MNREDIDYIQSAIGYTFKNVRLLYQAFTRKSYSAEHPESQDNEVLEFYGDEILDLYITKKMYKEFSTLNNNKELVSKKNEGELTKLKSIYVSKRTLSQCVYSAGFSRFLYMGNSDIKNEVWKSASVNEDLFEAIVGAVTVDCDWDFSILEKVCAQMLQMDSMNDYLATIISEKSRELGFDTPVYRVGEYQIENIEDYARPKNLFEARIGIRMPGTTSKNAKTGLHDYSVKIGDHFFAGSGNGVFQAKLDAEQKALNFLYHEELKQKINNIDYSNPVSQLHELVQKKIILEPIYDFSEYHDTNGNPIWRCTVSLTGVPRKFPEEDVSKKDVKQKAALELLHYLVDTVEEETEEWETPVFFLGGTYYWSDEQKAAAIDKFKRIMNEQE